LAAASAALLAAAPAAAAPVTALTTPQGRALILIPLTLTKVQDLHFGTIVAHPTQAVTVMIDPFTGNRFSSHPAQMFPTDFGQRGEFAGAGTTGQLVIMALTPPATLSDGAGNSLTVVSLFMDGPPTRVIGAGKSFFVNVGGVIQVPADAADGLYSAEYDLTADYQ
jgi:hypothetical protein